MSNTSIPTFEIIRELVKGICSEKTKDGYENYIECEYKGIIRTLWGCKYLLNQVLRQIDVPTSHMFVSKKARELWEDIDPRDEEGKKINIKNCYYHEKLLPQNKETPVFRYSGSNKSPTTTKKEAIGESFIFRDIFHVEHIVPVVMIIDELKNVYKNNGNAITDDQINELLGKIYICRMTKEEDRDIQQKYKRDLDYRKVKDTVYKNTKSGIPIEIENY